MTGITLHVFSDGYNSGMNTGKHLLPQRKYRKCVTFVLLCTVNHLFLHSEAALCENVCIKREKKVIFIYERSSDFRGVF